MNELAHFMPQDCLLAIYWLDLSSRVLHLLAAIVLVGGLFYLRMIVAPNVPDDRQGDPDAWFAGGRGSWAKWVGIATGVLLLTGLFNFMQIVRSNESLGGTYHMLFGIKLLAALALFFLASMLAGRTAAARRFQQNMKMWLGVCVLVGVLIVALGSVLRSLPHVPKAAVAPAPLLIQPSTGEPASQAD